MAVGQAQIMSKPALGRGLGALLGGAQTAAKPATSASAPAEKTAAPKAAEESPGRENSVAIDRIQPSKLQPRRDFSEESLKELADSIRAKGIIQPLVVRRQGNNFELIAGERRWRASKLAGLTELPIVIKEADDHSVLQMMLIENLQRENLNPIDEALGYERLGSEFKLRQEDIASQVGKSRVSVTNALRLLKLPAAIQDQIRQGQLSSGHAKVILGLDNPRDQATAATAVVKDGLSVRATEEWVTRWQAHRSAPEQAGSPMTAPPRDVHIADLEARLQERFGSKVALRYKKGRGSITIQFFNDDDLDRLLGIFSVKVD